MADRREALKRWRIASKPANVEASGELPLARHPAYVYLVFDQRGRVLYVGLTKNVARRLAAHERRGAAWWPSAWSVQWEAFGSRQEAALREGELIRDLDPPHNELGGLRYWNGSIRRYGSSSR